MHPPERGRAAPTEGGNGNDDAASDVRDVHDTPPAPRWEYRLLICGQVVAHYHKLTDALADVHPLGRSWGVGTVAVEEHEGSGWVHRVDVRVKTRP